MIDLYFLIPPVDALIFNPTAELVIPTRTPANQSNAEIKTQPLKAEQKQGNAQSISKPDTPF